MRIINYIVWKFRALEDRRAGRLNRLLFQIFYGFFFAGFLVSFPVFASELETTIQAGYRQDQLDWNIAGGGVNVLSELSWDNLRIYEVEGRGRYEYLPRTRRFGLALEGSLGYGVIDSGENQDSDYSGSDRTLEWSRSNNRTDGGHVLDASLGLGVPYLSSLADVRFTPLLGYSYHRQKLVLTDGVQTLSEQALADQFFGAGEVTVPPQGAFSGLDSSYSTQWYGPWAGLEVASREDKRFSFSGRFEYHLAEYRAEGDWNLRDDLQHPKSFSHDAVGRGLVGEVAGRYRMTPRWALHLAVDYSDWRASDGTDIIYLADGTVARTRLNEVNWTSFAVKLGAVYRFP